MLTIASDYKLKHSRAEVCVCVYVYRSMYLFRVEWYLSLHAAQSLIITQVLVSERIYIIILQFQ